MSLIQLQLAATNATLSNLNTRTEKAGDADVPAADLNFVLNAGREILDTFSPTLKTDFFNENGPRDLADGVPLKHPEVKGPLDIEGEMTGAKLIIAAGVNKPIELFDVKIGKFKFTPMEGGSVVLGFQVQCKPDYKQIGRLYELQKQTVEIGIVPAELPELPDAETPPAGRGKSVPKTGDGATLQ